MFTKIGNGLLLDEFRKFELNEQAKKQILGGLAYTNGCSQNGGNSFIDFYLVDNCTQYCDQPVGTDDAAGWCANMTFQ